eukprot:6192525-Pleurochrysis_carterae.AAC.1
MAYKDPRKCLSLLVRRGAGYVDLPGSSRLSQDTPIQTEFPARVLVEVLKVARLPAKQFRATSESGDFNLHNENELRTAVFTTYDTISPFLV